MKIQRFEAETTHDALARVQRTLGEDAVILQTRTIRPAGGGRSHVEVLAALDLPAVTPAEPEPAPNAGWRDEMAFVRKELSLLRSALGKGFATAPPRADVGSLEDRLHAGLKTSAIQLKPVGATTLCLVGPTGVGKTTTLAKLAAAARSEGKRVALVTTDTYRIGAVEQLETYARLMESPFVRVAAHDNLRDVCARFANYDAIFIDTVGRASSNQSELAQQAALMAQIAADEVHLCLDSSASRATLDRCVAGFAALRPTHVLLTKLDESASLADALESVLAAGIPLSYVTTGQRVPEDVALATPALLVSRLCGEGV